MKILLMITVVAMSGVKAPAISFKSMCDAIDPEAITLITIRPFRDAQNGTVIPGVVYQCVRITEGEEKGTKPQRKQKA